MRDRARPPGGPPPGASVPPLTPDETRRVRAVLYLQGLPRDEIEDGVQDVQLRLLQLPEPPEHPGAWACAVATNYARDKARRATRRRVAEHRLRLERRTPDDGDLALKHAVRKVLDTLSPELRQVLVLRCFADLTVPEIARELGEPEGTIKSRLHRAGAKMRAALPREQWR
ncbi:MAG TPA: sigma-70 family RNA polymerase sigma factor [Mycobacteriales bacterium]|jgi:RNA polymerase sigma-70 factor (ECF subfamily)|nr:sigma-70 family RNA polymerase sigma factor [Mycobacteriales bacterium]